MEPAAPADHALTVRRRWAAVGWALAGAALALWWPGDVPFINDEPMLVQNALLANRAGHLAPVGLLGSLGITYHPLPTWLYQALLLAVPDLLWLARVKILLSVGFTLWPLVRLALALRLPPWPLLLVCAAPQLWHYHRMLWDNVWLIPLAAWACWAAYRFLAEPSRWRLAACGALAVTMFLVHPMSLLLTVPALAAIALARAAWLRREWPTVLAVAVVGGLLCARMLWPLLTKRQHEPLLTMGWGEALLAVAAPLGLFGGQGLVYQVPELYCPWFPLPLAVTRALVWGLWALGGGLLVLGSARVVRRLLVWRRERQPLSPTDWLGVACLLAWPVHAAQCLIQRHTFSPHYMNATWVAWFFLLWLGVQTLAGRRLGRALAAVYVTAAVALLGATMYFLHVSGGTRQISYGPTLATQVAAARVLREYSPHTPQGHQVLNFTLFPHAFPTVLMLTPPAAAPRTLAPGLRLVVAYRDTPHPAAGGLRVAVKASLP